MLFSESFIFTAREDPKAAECNSHKFLLKGCFLFMVSSGIYSYLPLGWRVLTKIKDVIRKHMNSAGAQELLMSALQPIEFWQKTGRDKDLEEVMFRFGDRRNRQLCLGPTHEEEITEIAKRYVASYKQLPFILYQIQTKYRDEPRPRFGLMRSCEFMMKDAYSFDVDQAGLNENYEKMLAAYKNIFKECGLEFIVTEADSGVMGGSVSHEFMVPAEVGEDILFSCARCGTFLKKEGKCPVCEDTLVSKRMIEVGHIFKLGTKYSSLQEALFVDSQGERKPMIMGCYGIGVSRLFPSIVEKCFDAKGIIWPRTVSPFDVTLVALEDRPFKEAVSISEGLEKAGFSVLLDDRQELAGVKFNDAYLIGNPYILIVGKNYLKSGKIDVEIRCTGEKKSLTREELVNFLKSEYDR